LLACVGSLGLHKRSVARVCKRARLTSSWGQFLPTCPDAYSRALLFFKRERLRSLPSQVRQVRHGKTACSAPTIGRKARDQRAPNA